MVIDRTTLRYEQLPLQEVCVKKAKTDSAPEINAPLPEPSPMRERIVYAAVAAFLERGYPNVSMLEIATRARISNRDLYAEFENKSALLAYCVSFRAQKIRRPEGMPAIVDEGSLRKALLIFGEHLLQELTDPEVLLVYYLAIVECWRAPEIGNILDECGRQSTKRVLGDLLKQAQVKGLLAKGDAEDMVDEFLALLLQDLTLRLILRVIPRPRQSDFKRRALVAAEAFLILRRRA